MINHTRKRVGKKKTTRKISVGGDFSLFSSKFPDCSVKMFDTLKKVFNLNKLIKPKAVNILGIKFKLMAISKRAKAAKTLDKMADRLCVAVQAFLVDYAKFLGVSYESKFVSRRVDLVLRGIENFFRDKKNNSENYLDCSRGKYDKRYSRYSSSRYSSSSIDDKTVYHESSTKNILKQATGYSNFVNDYFKAVDGKDIYFDEKNKSEETRIVLNELGNIYNKINTLNREPFFRELKNYLAKYLLTYDDDGKKKLANQKFSIYFKSKASNCPAPNIDRVELNSDHFRFMDPDGEKTCEFKLDSISEVPSKENSIDRFTRFDNPNIKYINYCNKSNSSK